MRITLNISYKGCDFLDEPSHKANKLTYLKAMYGFIVYKCIKVRSL